MEQPESPEVRTLTLADSRLFFAHFARHREESGNGDIHFMPFAPGDPLGPRGLDLGGLSLTLDQTDWQRWFIAVTSEPRVVGHVDLKGDSLKTGLHRCELGIGIERGFRGHGLGRRLMEVAIGFSRDAQVLRWLDLRVFAHNTRALALYRSLGFEEVGTLRDRFRIGEVSIDDIIMTLRVG